MQGFDAMFFGHEGLEVHRRHVIRSALMLAPFQKEAVGHAAVNA